MGGKRETLGARVERLEGELGELRRVVVDLMEVNAHHWVGPMEWTLRVAELLRRRDAGLDPEVGGE